MDKRLTAYLRNQGPICYETEILDLNNKQALEEWTKQLFDIGLGWYWESARARPPAEGSPYLYLPEQRPLTLLNSISLESFLDDLSERDVDGYARFFAVFGVDTDVALNVLDDAQFRSALNSFLKDEEGPIRITVIQIGDSPWEHVYVSHNPIKPVQELLESWKIIPSAEKQERPYKHLNIARFESILEPIFAVARGRPYRV